jgi:hypothetical protein
MLATLLLLAGQAHATDVLVPTITPRSLSDFAPAERLTEEVLNQMADKGIAFVPPSEIQKRAGEVADGCADLPQCTTILWRHFPQGRLAVVGSVEYEKGTLHAIVRFYGPDDGSPIEMVEERFPEAQIPAFAARITRMSQEISSLVPTRAPVAVATAREPSRAGTSGSSAARPRPNTYDELDQPNRTADLSGPPSQNEEFERRTAGLPTRVWDRYRESGLPYEEWKEKALVRAGSLIVELHAGAVFGDVDRTYDTRVSFEQVGSGTDDFEQKGAYQYESFVRGSGFLVGGAVGYAPLWWLEASLFGGVQLGHKKLSIGYEAYEQGGVADATRRVDSYTESPPAVTATMATIEPRLRFLTLPSGPVKPYILTGITTRFYDGFDDPLLSGAVTYPKRAGGVSLGVTAGGGIAFDAPRGAIGFIEIPWTALISPKPFSGVSGDITNLPRQETGANQLLAFRAGVGYRFK